MGQHGYSVPQPTTVNSKSIQTSLTSLNDVHLSLETKATSAAKRPEQATARPTSWTKPDMHILVRMDWRRIGGGLEEDAQQYIGYPTLTFNLAAHQVYASNRHRKALLLKYQQGDHTFEHDDDLTTTYRRRIDSQAPFLNKDLGHAVGESQ